MRTVLVAAIALIVGFGVGRWQGAQLPAPEIEAEAPTSAAKTEEAPVPPTAPAPRPAGQQVAVTPVAPPPTETPAETPEFPDSAEKETAGGTEVEAPMRPEPKPTPAALAKLQNLPAAVVDKLEATRRNNFRQTLKTAAQVKAMTPQIQGLMGRFEGDILVDEQNGKTWQIEIENSGTVSNGALRGKSRSRLYRGGKLLVSSEQDGRLKSIRTVGDGKTTFILQISDNYYLEAFHDPNTDTLSGNFYAKNSKNGFGYRGPAQLTRAN